MHKIKTKRIIAAAVLAALSLTLFGCGSDPTEGKSGREIHKDGSVEAVIVTPFDETYYSVADLKAMIDEEVSGYNFDHAGDKISPGDVSCTDGVLTCVMNFSSDEDYAEFNTRRFMIEDFATAMASDLVKISVKSVKDLAQTDLHTVTDGNKLSVLITDEPGYVIFPGKVRYISDGVEVLDKKTVNVLEDMDGLAYIIYEIK
ncbi:MAG: hypothetical protein J5509_04395 [Lachnospiraceae bacterium]|nr:hypothetical protein [Lachnospiraceae bacterium]